MQHRRLPHEYPEDRALFLTWHLHGSLPASRFPPPGSWKSGKAFVWTDRYLDTTREGPLWLKRAEVADIIETSIRFCEKDLDCYQLEAYVIMANHVHMLIWPHTPPTTLLRTLKGYTARECNKLLGLTGNPFWQKESYDHWVRTEDELRKIAAYIEHNPVTAGITRNPEDYRWSSARHRARS